MLWNSLLDRTAGRALLALMATIALVACSQKVETPTPAIEPPSSAAAPPPVDPEIVCRDQLASRVTVHGENFTPLPIDLPGSPKLALPTVVLSRTHELDGGAVSSPDQIVYSGDHDADPTNALDGDGELILVDGEPLLTWTSPQEMSFLVTQELVLGTRPAGTDTREQGVLAEGVWDVAVRNPEGRAAESLGALAVVKKPELEELSPGIVCLEQGARTIALTGQTFLRNEGDQVELAVEGVSARFEVELADCTAIAHEGLDAEVCRSAAVQLARDSIDLGYPLLTLENPETAACASEEQVALRVVPAPRIERVVEALACLAQGARSFLIEGSDFLRVDDTRLPTVRIGDAEVDVASMDCEPMALAAGSHSIEVCSAITIMLTAADLEPGLYDVSVVNPDNPGHPDNGDPPGCSATATGALRIVPPPSIDAVEPSYVCLEDGTREVTVQGSDFLVINGVEPTVEVNGEALAANAVEPAGCNGMALGVGDLEVTRCDRLVLSLSPGSVDLGNPTLKVSNALPAGCEDEATELWTVLPRPTLASATPQPICNEQGADVLTLTGTGFLELDGAVPTVTIGGVAASSVSVNASTCAAIPDRSDGRLCTELSVTLAEGTIMAGLHDVVVTNTDPAGCETADGVAIAFVDAPEITLVQPNPICLSQNDVVVTVTGVGFVRIGATQPSVTFGDVTATGAVVTEATCTAIPGTADAVSCTELTATLAMSALADGTESRVTVTNPATAACASEEEVDLRVVPPPAIASLDSANVCTGGGTVSITGTNLAGVTARLVDPDTQGVIDALHTVVNDAGTQATITFGSGVQPDTYELVISSASGCGDTAAQNVVAVLGPVSFFMDPPVAYSGVSLRATIYASGLSVAPANVILTPQGGGSVDDQELLTNVAWPSGGSNNKVGATIPAGLDQGVYDVTLDFATGCDTVLPAGLRVEDDVTLALLTPALVPQFGEEGTDVAVNVRAKTTADLASGEVNFAPTPRAYVSSASLSTAEPLRAVAFDTPERLTAIVPDTLLAGVYDLVVVNPDGSVGFQAGAFEVTSVAPPVIDDVTPTQFDNDIARPIAISGSSFFNPTTDMRVTLECRAPNATASTSVGPLAIDGASTDTSLVATVPAGISHGSVCVVRVENTTNDTFDEFSAITVTNPASKLPAFQSGTTLVEGRRAPATVLGAATREARFLYAIGGDDGNAANAKRSVEGAPIGRFGDAGVWRTLATALPVGITQAHAVSGGRYVYLFGGLAGGDPSAAIHRAVVLDPSAAPVVSDVDLRFYATPDSDPATRDGLAPGAWTYVIAAVFDAGDEDNPGGESLPSEPLTLYAPDVPDGVEVELTWDPVYGNDGVTEAVSYRIYRSVSADSGIASLRLLAEVAAPDHSYVDQNPAVFLDADKRPLAVGDLGEWRTLQDELNTPRAAYGIALANDPNCNSYLYLLGGRTDTGSESATYEYATFDALTGALGGFVEATGTGLTARRELALLVADDKTSAQINPVSGCESYVYASSGYSGSTSFVTSIQVAAVQNGGVLAAFAGALNAPSPQQFAGHAAFFSSDGAYVMGGAGNTAAPPSAINTALQADMCSGGICSAPSLGNFSSASNNLQVARYLPGFARQGAFFYLVGGANSSGAALSSTERNVR
jgi:hypothetical protein